MTVLDPTDELTFPMREARIDRGLTLAQFAQMAGVSTAAASRWERNIRRPHPADVQRIAAVLQCDEAEVRTWVRASPPIFHTLPSVAGFRSLRTSRGLTRADIARRLGVSPQTIAHWESGRRRMPASRVAAAATALGMEPADFVRTVTALPAQRERRLPPLTTIRRSRGLTLSEVGRRLGVTHSSVRSWEIGRSRLSWPRVRQLADLYRVPPSTVARAAGVDEPGLLDPNRWQPGSLPTVMRGVREWRGDTQDHIGTLVGVTGQTIRRWEMGMSTPRPSQVSALEWALGLRQGVLLQAA